MIAVICHVNDAWNRRIVKAVTNCGDWDRTYHYYYDGRRMVEERDGSDNMLKQYVWGLQYVDELIGVRIRNQHFWACQDSNFNVLGLVNGSGRLVERYEYTPYGRGFIEERHCASNNRMHFPIEG